MHKGLIITTSITGTTKNYILHPTLLAGEFIFDLISYFRLTTKRSERMLFVKSGSACVHCTVTKVFPSSLKIVIRSIGPYHVLFRCLQDGVLLRNLNPIFEIPFKQTLYLLDRCGPAEDETCKQKDMVSVEHIHWVYIKKVAHRNTKWFTDNVCSYFVILFGNIYVTHKNVNTFFCWNQWHEIYMCVNR
jgi:hypothetical protein